MQHWKKFSWKIIHKMWWRNYSQNLSWKIKIEHIFVSMILSFTQSFYVSQVEDYQEKLKLSCRPLAFTWYKALLKNKKGLELVSLPHFLPEFWKKNIFLLLYSITWPNFIVWLLLLHEILENMCILIIFNQVITS